MHGVELLAALHVRAERSADARAGADEATNTADRSTDGNTNHSPHSRCAPAPRSRPPPPPPQCSRYPDHSTHSLSTLRTTSSNDADPDAGADCGPEHVTHAGTNGGSYRSSKRSACGSANFGRTDKQPDCGSECITHESTDARTHCCAKHGAVVNHSHH